MAADIYTNAFQDAVKGTNLCEQINIVEQTDLAQPHLHALHALLLTESSDLLPESMYGWDSGWGWHEHDGTTYEV